MSLKGYCMETGRKGNLGITGLFGNFSQIAELPTSRTEFRYISKLPKDQRLAGYLSKSTGSFANSIFRMIQFVKKVVDFLTYLFLIAWIFGVL